MNFNAHFVSKHITLIDTLIFYFAWKRTIKLAKVLVVVVVYCFL